MIGSVLLDRYELVDVLGEGGMGIVYLALDPVLHRKVAIKILAPRLSGEAEVRFLREAQLVAQMDHASIVPIHDFGRFEGSPFFVMPLIRGTTLRQLLRSGPLSVAETLEIGEKVAWALDYSHHQGVIHRDVKPSNIMIERETGSLRVRVMDFGVALEASDAPITRTGDILGTAAYSSPEQVSGEELDGRSDLYSLGAALYQCLKGKPPFTGPVRTILYRTICEPARSLLSQGVVIDPALDRLLLSCLAKNPEERPKSGAELAKALSSIASELAGEPSVRIPARRFERQFPEEPPMPLVGRQSELAELSERFDRVVTGECHFVLIGGEEGTGKRRLLRELEQLARSRRTLVLRGRFAGLESALPYQGICDLIQDYFRGLATGSLRPAALPDFSDLAPHLVSLFPVLSEIGELRSTGPLHSKSDCMGNDPTEIFELLARTLVRMACGQSMVLLLENLHSADVGIEALKYIVRRLGPTPTLVVSTYRLDSLDRSHPLNRLKSSFLQDPRFVSMQLLPLDLQDFRSLLDQLLESSDVSEDVALQLWQATEGNPFFGRELIRSLRETGGLLRTAEGAWVLTGDSSLTKRALPRTIQETVERRVDRLPSELRKILAHAAVLGRSFDYGDLEQLVATDELEESIEALLVQGILNEDRKSRGDRLRFASGVVRDFLYQSVPRRRRRALHRQHAEHLEQRFAGGLERVYPQLVHHFSEGDVAEKTVEYALALARRALLAFSPEDAIRATRKATEFVEEEEISTSSPAKGELLRILAEAQFQSGDPERALREAERSVAAFETASCPDRVAFTALLAAEIAWQGRFVDKTRFWIESGIEQARRSGSVDCLRRLLTLGGSVANLGGEHHEAKIFLEEAERLAADEMQSRFDEAVPQGGSLVAVLPNPIASLLPGHIRRNEEAEVSGLVLDTLLVTDDLGNIASSLCEDWHIREGGRELSLTIREGVRFSDGTALTAYQIKECMETLVRDSDDPPSALLALQGIEAFREGQTQEISGIRAESEHALVLLLSERLPILPCLLTDHNTAIFRRNRESPTGIVGTGPFAISRLDRERIVLERNDSYWGGAPPKLDRIEFLCPPDASAIAKGLLAGGVDLGRDLHPDDLEEILRDPRFRRSLVERTKDNLYFALFHFGSPLGKVRKLRAAMTGVIRTRDLIWRTVGRFAQPALDLIPPGILGHDPGKRHRRVSRDEARELLKEAGLALPITLRTAIHPLLQDRYASLTSELLQEWEELGIRIELATSSIDGFMAALHDSSGFDLVLGRWNADYHDPDTFTHGLFHSRTGVYRQYFSSSETDRILQHARQEDHPLAREKLYRDFVAILRRERAILPLFHDVDYRIASPRVRGLELTTRKPYVNYSQLGVAETEVSGRVATDRRSGGLDIPVAVSIETFDPAVGNILEYNEVTPCVFETLTRVDEGSQIVPWLASSFEAGEGGRCYHFQLRDGIRFHDGRRLTARDVRYSFERILQMPSSELHFLLLPIGGAKAMRDGRAQELRGFKILSAGEFEIELEEPLSMFPALLSHPAIAILPEGGANCMGTWKEGCSGTGPYRVVRFQPGKRIDLERNPQYWRPGYPRIERLTFHCGATPAGILSDFRDGRLSLASDLRPTDAEALRRDPAFAGGFRETPRLSTYFIALNTRRGPFSDPAIRRVFAESLDTTSALQQTLGRLVAPAWSVIPPGLLGYEEPRDVTPTLVRDPPNLRGMRIRVTMLPVYTGQYVAFWDRITRCFEQLGIEVEIVPGTTPEVIRHGREGTVDLIASRWIADYPDTDTFVVGLVHSEEGLLKGLCDSPEIDQLGIQGRRETDPKLRHSIYRNIEDLFRRQNLLIPLFHEKTYRFFSPELRGIHLGLSSPEVHYEELSEAVPDYS